MRSPRLQKSFSANKSLQPGRILCALITLFLAGVLIGCGSVAQTSPDQAGAHASPVGPNRGAPNVVSGAQPACGPPVYSCSRSDTAVLVAEAPPQLGADSRYYGGHSGAGTVGVDPAYGNRILRVTDGNTGPGDGISFNTGASAENNVTSYDENLFIAHKSGGELCLFSFNKSAFQATYRGCFEAGKGGGADFGYTEADNNAIYSYHDQKLYRYLVNTATWTVRGDPAFNHGQGYFDPDNADCLNGQIAANHWTVHDSALSSDDNTLIAAIGPAQDEDPYFVVWNAPKGCAWLNVKTWQVSSGWNTGLNDPVNISWADGVVPTGAGGIHNAQIDRSGSYGVLAIHNDGIANKMFWNIGTNMVDASCTQCVSHWACDFGVCFWNHQRTSGYAMEDLGIGSSIGISDMDSAVAPGETACEEHSSHANAQQGAKRIYLTSWEPSGGASAISQVWDDEITGINWNGTQRTIRFNKSWTSGYGFWATARCSISRQGNYALCGSDYQMYNLDKGFGDGLNEDTCDHHLAPAVSKTKGCRTDVLLFELR